MFPEYFALKSLEFIFVSSTGAIVGKIANYLADRVVGYVETKATKDDVVNNSPISSTPLSFSSFATEDDFIVITKTPLTGASMDHICEIGNPTNTFCDYLLPL